MDPQIKKKKWDWEKFCTYQDPKEEQEKRARAGPKLKSKQKFIKFGFWVLDLEENKDGLDSTIYVFIKLLSLSPSYFLRSQVGEQA